MASVPFRSRWTETGIAPCQWDIVELYTNTTSAQAAAETGTGPPVQALLTQCGLLSAQPAGTIILDNACGGGVITARLLEGSGSQVHGMKVICGDLDEVMVDMTAQRIAKHSWPAEAQVINAQV